MGQLEASDRFRTLPSQNLLLVDTCINGCYLEAEMH